MNSAKCASCIHTTTAKKCIKNHRLATALGVAKMVVSSWSTNKAQPTVAQLISIAKKILDTLFAELIKSHKL